MLTTAVSKLKEGNDDRSVQQDNLGSSLVFAQKLNLYIANYGHHAV